MGLSGAERAGIHAILTAMVRDGDGDRVCRLAKALSGGPRLESAEEVRGVRGCGRRRGRPRPPGDGGGFGAVPVGRGVPCTAGRDGGDAEQVTPPTRAPAVRAALTTLQLPAGAAGAGRPRGAQEVRAAGSGAAALVRGAWGGCGQRRGWRRRRRGVCAVGHLLLRVGVQRESVAAGPLHRRLRPDGRVVRGWGCTMQDAARWPRRRGVSPCPFAVRRGADGVQHGVPRAARPLRFPFVGGGGAGPEPPDHWLFQWARAARRGACRPLPRRTATARSAATRRRAGR